MKHAGQKSVKEELPEQRKGPKRAVECRLKVQTHVWEQDAAGSNPVTRTIFIGKTATFGGFSAFNYQFYLYLNFGGTVWAQLLFPSTLHQHQIRR